MRKGLSFGIVLILIFAVFAAMPMNASAEPEDFSLQLIPLTNDSANDYWPSFSPDGNSIIFSTDRAGFRTDIWIMAKDGSDKKPLTASGPIQDEFSRWSPTNDKIVFGTYRPWGKGGSIWLMDIDGSNQKQIYYKSGWDAYFPTWSPDGVGITFCCGKRSQVVDRDIYTIDSDGSNLKIILNDLNLNTCPSYSPSGNKILFISNRDGNNEIYIMDFDGSNLKRLSFTNADENFPSFSPNGEKIVFSSRSTNKENIWLMNADGSNPIQLTYGEFVDRYPAWSPDGREIVFSSNRNGYNDIWLLKIIPKINSTIDIDPNTLNEKNKGKWITCYIEFPEGYDVRDINASTILLEDTISPILDLKYGFVKSEKSYIMDHDGDGILERMAKFDRSNVEDMLPPGTYNLYITGKLYDGTIFEGYSDTIRVINPKK